MVKSNRTAVVVDARSGVGRATAEVLAMDGYEVVCVAPRVEQIRSFAAEIHGRAASCDVTDARSVANLAKTVGDRVDLLVNSPATAYSRSSIVDARPDDWSAMFDADVLGTLRLTTALLPALIASGDGLVINVGSTSGHEVYERGGGYMLSKHFVARLTEKLREELFGQPVRITEIAPGPVEVDTLQRRESGTDRGHSGAVEAATDDPFQANDVAECIRWVTARPSHVNVDLLVVRSHAMALQQNA